MRQLILCQNPIVSNLSESGEFDIICRTETRQVVHHIGDKFYGVVEKVVYRHPQPKVCRAVITFVTGTTFDVSCHHVPDVYKHDMMAITVKKRWSKKKGHYFEPVIAVYRRRVVNPKKKRKK